MAKKSKGWAQGRDRVNPEGVAEIANRMARGVGLSAVVIDQALADREILPSREQIYGVIGKRPTPGVGYATLGGNMVGGYDENPGTRRTRVRRDRSTGRSATIKRQRRWDQTPKPDSVSPVDWGMLKLAYVDRATAPEIAAPFKGLTADAVRQRCSRARRASEKNGYPLPK